MSIQTNPFFLKARKYCDFQERSHAEVRATLRKWKVFGKEAEELISALITEGYLNEERFARSFVRGKFRMKKWGKKKIVAALRQKGVTDYCIREGLDEIENEEYLKTLHQVCEKKKSTFKGKAGKKYTPVELQKVAQYAVSRGFEPNLVWRELKLEEENH